MSRHWSRIAVLVAAAVAMFGMLAVASAARTGAVTDGGRGGTAVTGVVVDCDDITVTSTKDISNVIVKYADGTYAKFDGLTGYSFTIANDGPHGRVVAVWIKSGANHDPADPDPEQFNSGGVGKHHAVPPPEGCDPTTTTKPPPTTTTTVPEETTTTTVPEETTTTTVPEETTTTTVPDGTTTTTVGPQGETTTVPPAPTQPTATVGPTAASVPPASGPAGAGELPHTGGAEGPLALMAIASLLAGTALVVRVRHAAIDTEG